MGNSLTTSTKNDNIDIDEENQDRDDNISGDDDAGEGTSSVQPAESIFTDDPLLLDNQLMAADRLLISVYGDTIHDNDGSHMSGRIVDNKLWQQYWTDLTALPIQYYDVLSGSVGRRFLFMLVEILDGVVERKWNVERFIVFTAVILQQQKGVRSYHNVRQHMEHWMDLWEKADFRALVEDTIKINKC
eukprot:15340358-Ditylum_brightwellii.AAC.1